MQIAHNEIFDVRNEFNGTSGVRTSQDSPWLGAPSLQAETIVKNTFLEFKMEDSEDEDSVFVPRCRRRSTRTCPCQLGREEADHESAMCSDLPGAQDAHENVELPHDSCCSCDMKERRAMPQCVLASSCERPASVHIDDMRRRMPQCVFASSCKRTAPLHIDNTSKPGVDTGLPSEKGSMRLMPNFATVVKNTFIDFEDEDMAVMQKNRRYARTCPHHLGCGEDSPAYVQVPLMPVSCIPSEASPPQASTSPLQVEDLLDRADCMQAGSSLSAKDTFKLAIKNTFIELDVCGLEDDDLLFMQKCRRDSQTCPHDLGCREDMPAYISLPASPYSRGASLSVSWKTDMSSLQASDLIRTLDNLGHNTGFTSTARPASPDEMRSTIPALSTTAPNGADLALMEKGPSKPGCEESLPGYSAQWLPPTLQGGASLLHTCEQLLVSRCLSPLEISADSDKIHTRPTLSSVCGTRESPHGNRPFISADNDTSASAEAVSASRRRLQSYGNEYSASCSKSVQQPISLDSMLRADGEQLSAATPFSSNISFMQSPKVHDEMYLIRALMHQDRPQQSPQLPPPPPHSSPSSEMHDYSSEPAAQVPPPPEYSAPSSEMLGIGSDSIQKQPSLDCCKPEWGAEKFDTSMHNAEAMQRAPKTITEMYLLSSPDVIACTSREDVDMAAKPADLELGQVHKRRPCGRRSATAKPANRTAVVQQEGASLLTKLPVESQIANLTAIRSIAKKRNCRAHSERLWCHLYIDKAMLEDGFDLVKKIIGREGCNTKTIYNETLTKIRVRGQGSGHREMRSKQEAPVHLMMALAADHGSHEDFRKAFVMAKDLLQDVARRFEGFCRRRHPRANAGPRFWVGESTDESLECLRDVLGDIPVGRLDLEA